MLGNTGNSLYISSASADRRGYQCDSDLLLGNFSWGYIEPYRDGSVRLVHTSGIFQLVNGIHFQGTVLAPRMEEVQQSPQASLQRVAYLHWNAANFFHFMVEVLPKVIWLEDRHLLGTAAHQYKALVPINRPGRELFSLLGLRQQNSGILW